MCRFDDGDYWTLYSSATRRAAKPHRCDECRRTIAKGESYNYGSGLYDGYWQTFRICLHCMEVTRWLQVACSGWNHTEVEPDLADHVIGDERYLRSSALTRLLRWMRADWRDGAGNVRPVEEVQAVATRAIDAYRRLAELGLR